MANTLPPQTDDGQSMATTLAELLSYRGFQPEFARAALDGFYVLTIFAVITLGVPLSLQTTYLSLPFQISTLAPVFTVSLAALLLAMKRFLSPSATALVLPAIFLSITLLMWHKNSSLAVASIPLLLAESVIFVRFGTIAAAASIISVTALGAWLVADHPEFRAIESALAYGLHASTTAMLLTAVFMVDRLINAAKKEAETTRNALTSARDGHYRETSLLTQELRSPATSVFMLVQNKNITDAVKKDILTSLDQLEAFTQDINTVNSASGLLPVIKVFSSIHSIIFDIFQQIRPLLSGHNIELELLENDEIKTLVQLDALRVRGALLHLCRIPLALNSIKSLQFSTNMHQREGSSAIDVDLLLTCEPTIAQALMLASSSEGSASPDYNLASREYLQARTWILECGGAIRLEATSKGALIHCVIPIEHGEPEPKLAEALAAATLSGKRVLIVDDDGITRRATSSLLRHSFGATVDEAASVEEGWRMYKANTDYALLITDFSMPKDNGDDLVRRIRSESQQLPIITVIASAMQTDIARLLGEGANLVLPKPLSVAVLNKALLDIAVKPSDRDR